MREKPLKIAIATGGRADWGLLSPLAKSLGRHADVTVLATNMHLLPETGMTVNEIIADGFTPLWIPVSGTPVEITAATTEKFGEAFDRLAPDAVVILGDRYEMLGVATAALLKGVPIVHIAGGTVSEGAFDDSIRHAITKMSTLHFAETERYRENIIQMGEDPARVLATGAIGVSGIHDMDLMSRDELESDLGLKLKSPLFLATLHAATLDPESPAVRMRDMIAALDSIPGSCTVFTYPNNDVDPQPQIELMEQYCRENPGRGMTIPSLGRRRYMSLLQYADAVVGNSSGGIVEVASMGIPTLDIGVRQQGRDHAPSVVHCEAGRDSIAEGLRKVLSPEIKALAARRENPYFRPDTVTLMTEAILNYPFRPFPSKRFFMTASATSQSRGVSRSTDESADIS